jgi:hypothetical protein
MPGNWLACPGNKKAAFSISARIGLNQFKKFVARLHAFKYTSKSGGLGNGILFLNSPHHHAHMPCLNDNGGTHGLKVILKAMKDFMGETFLHLKASAKDVNQPGQLAQPYDIAVRDIGNMRFAKKRKHVVLTKAVKFNVFDQDHFTVIFPE